MKTQTPDSTKQPETENHYARKSFLQCPVDSPAEQNHIKPISLKTNDADNGLKSKGKEFVERNKTTATLFALALKRA